MITFDGPNLLVRLDPAQLTYSDTELYSRWSEWVHAGDGAKYYPAFVQSDAVVLPSGDLAPVYTVLQNSFGWRMMLPDTDRDYTINGNVIPDNGAIEYFIKPSGFTPNIQINTSDIAIQTNSDSDYRAELAQIAANQERLLKVYGLLPDGVFKMPPATGGAVLEDGVPIADVSGDCSTGFTVTGRPS